MNAKDWKLKPVQENYDLQDMNQDDDEETLSLCDLASDDYWGDEFSKENQSNNCFDEQEMFEFFGTNGDFSASASPKDDSIIFCGKLIPYKGDKQEEKEDEEEEEEYQPIKDQTKKISRKLFSWKSFSLNRSRSCSSSLKINHQQEKSYRTCKTFPESSSENKKNNSDSDFPVKKVSLLSSPSRSRWYLFAFGVGRYPMEIKLRDIKTRQSKLSDSKMRQSIKNPMSIFRSDDDKLADRRSEKKEKSWWGLFRNFGCKSSQANAMVKASLGCIA